MEMNQLLDIINYNKKNLFFYSNYSFLKEYDENIIVDETVIKPLISDIQNKVSKVINITINKQIHFFIVKLLEWDSNYFGFPTFRIEQILYSHKDSFILNKAISKFIDLYAKNNDYFMMNVPCEDLTLIQALSNTKFVLIETRLNYFLPNIEEYKSTRYRVRQATNEDSEYLREVAIRMRNKYDRVHSDPAFSEKKADIYLGDFIVESVKGFADIVLVPDLENQKPFGFLAGNYPISVLNTKISKLVLAAVDSSVEKGWLFRLLSEMIYVIKDKKADYLTTITQNSNRKAIQVWERAGFHLGFSTLLYSYKKQ